VVVAVSSAVVLAAIVMQIKVEHLTHTPDINFIISTAAITMTIATLFASAIILKIGFILKAEMPSAFASLFIWIIAIALLFYRTDLAMRTTLTNDLNLSSTVSNANIYYFSWASVIFSLELFIETLINFVKIDFIAIGKTKSSRRFTQWCILVLASIVSLSSSVRFFRSAGCNDILIILFTLGFWTKPCTAARFTLATGVIVCVLTLSTIIAAFLLKGKKKIIFVVEIIVSSLSLLFYAIAVGLITAPNAPGSEIGNLYYFTWFSLAVSIMLFVDCLMEKFHPSESQVEISPVVANTAELPPAEISSVVATAEIPPAGTSPVVAKMPPAEISLVVATAEMPSAATSSDVSMPEMHPAETFPEASITNQTQATLAVGEAQV